MANTSDWLNISQESGGTGQTSLTLTALTNSSLSAKTATITAKNDTYNVSGTSTVTIQGFVPTLTLSRSTLRFDSTGGTATFTVYSNTSWTITYPALVYSYSTSAGTGDTEVTVVLAPNPDEVAKIDTGIVKDTYNINQLYLTIVQESFIAELTVEPDDDIEFVNTGSSTSVTVTTNTDWEVNCPSWITPSSYSGESGTTVVTFTASQNGPTDRRDTIMFYAGSKEVGINVTQPFYIPPYITVTPSAWTFDYEETGKTFVVDSYPEWSAEIISSSETSWDTTYMIATYVITDETGATIPLYTTSSSSVTGIYVGPVKYYGSSLSFSSAGTYQVCYELTSGATIPCFSGNTYLTEVYLSDGITELPYRAFKNCINLRKIVSESQTAPSLYADYDTFYNVHYDGTLVYPAGSDYSNWLSLKSGYLGFYNWNHYADNYTLHIATVTYNVESTDTPTKILNSSYQMYAFKDSSGNIFKNTVESYTAHTFSSTGSQTLDFYYYPGYGSSGIGDINFNISGISAVTDVVINDYPVTAIGTTLRQLCSLYAGSAASLTALTLNADVYSNGNVLKNVRVYNIGGRTGDGMFPISSNASWEYGVVANLREVTISSSGLTELPEYMFNMAQNLSSVTISTNTIATIGTKAFNKTGITGITLPNSITTLSTSAFSECTQLSSATIPSGVTQIPNACFYKCSSLSSVTLPSTVTGIGTSSFSNCNIRSIELPNTITSLGNQAFYNNTALTSVTLSDSITTIGEGCFQQCSGLTTISLPSHLTTLSKNCFRDCISLVSIYIGDAVNTVGNTAFQNCASLQTIDISATIAPSIPNGQTNTAFRDIATGGTLYYPAGSDYSNWLSNDSSYHLGRYGWIGVEK